MANFELVDGDWIKEYVWKYFEEEDVEDQFIACGYDSNHIQYTMGFPLYIYGWSLILLAFLYTTQCCVMRKVKSDDLEGGEEDHKLDKPNCNECCAIVCSATQKCCSR